MFLANGLTIEGKDLRMTMETATIDISGQDQVLLLTDVVQIMAKQGKGKRFGQNCAGSCVGVYLGLMLASGGTTVDADGNETDINLVSAVMELAIFGGVSYGIGYLVGRLSDSWQVVYLNRG
ncbi:MAG: hypothetical protein L3J79_07285 [Candidatus Marinimicrobia bacterium]|nr:hypothetical protein [Candidatus Neomarinimicrobiota bacterium]